MGNPLLFYFLAFIAVAAALGMLRSKNAIHSALFLVLTMCAIAVFYLVLSAPFIAMVQITVYAGAIMVLFLFVIMLLGAEKLQAGRREGANWQPWTAGVLGLGLLGSFIWGVLPGLGSAPDEAVLSGGPQAIGVALFQHYVFPFEVTSILLLVAMIGVVVWQASSKER